VDGYDVLRAAVRWIHVAATVVWLGGSIFYLLVLGPALPRTGANDSTRSLEMAINRGFRDLVDLSIIALIVTGVLITLDRLDHSSLGTAYFVVLALKIVAALSMFVLARDLGTRLGRRLRPRPPGPLAEPSLAQGAPGRHGWRSYLSPARLIVILGLIALFLSALLVYVFESEVGGIS